MQYLYYSAYPCTRKTVLPLMCENLQGLEMRKVKVYQEYDTSMTIHQCSLFKFFTLICHLPPFFLPQLQLPVSML